MYVVNFGNSVTLFLLNNNVHTVLNPKEKTAHFQRHWSDDLQQKVLDCAEEIVCHLLDI